MSRDQVTDVLLTGDAARTDDRRMLITLVIAHPAGTLYHIAVVLDHGGIPPALLIVWEFAA